MNMWLRRSACFSKIILFTVILLLIGNAVLILQKIASH